MHASRPILIIIYVESYINKQTTTKLSSHKNKFCNNLEDIFATQIKLTYIEININIA